MEYKLKKEELKILKDIEGHFEEIQNLFNQLDAGTQQAINQEHGERTSLNYCLRWGNTALAELIDNPILQNY